MEGATAIYTKNQIAGAFFVGLAVGLGAYFVWDTKGGGVPAGTREENTAEQGGESVVMESKNSVTVSDQLAGFSVIISEIVSENGGWVVIHEDADGKPGNILGAQRVDTGSFEDITVDLLRNTEEERTYYAMLHEDDGDKQFNHGKDSAVISLNGAPVMDAFDIIRK